jgi:hypothetical protein
MKKLLLFLLFFLIIAFLSAAQEDSRIYKTSITEGGGHELYGTLYQIKDSSILLANTFRRMDILLHNFDLTTINHNDISFITIREKKDVSNGVRIGMLAGAATGVIIGIISGTQATKKEYSGYLGRITFIPPELEIALSGVLVGAIGAGVGAGTGAIISSISVGIKIPIYGSFDRFNENKDRLKQFSYMH